MDIMSNDKKRDRCRNYTETERFTLLDIVQDYMPIIKNKKTDNVHVQQKNKAWNDIALRFNAVAETGRRTGIQLKLLYDGIRKKVKKDRMEVYKTGTFADAIAQKMLQLDDEIVLEIVNPYDSSSPLDISNTAITPNDDYITPDNHGTDIAHNETTPKQPTFTIKEELCTSPESEESMRASPTCSIEEAPSCSRNPLPKKRKRQNSRNNESATDQKEDIKLKMLKVRLEKEEIERDILLLKKKELELNLQDRIKQLEASRKSL